ncbi:hypothetical protein KJ652_04970 [Patescibacteria group bacterium]|nr:hypothetical protein [Patescibacteria group bacterium]MBU1123918.1 hypothetical protein [Patescibacteria group bacterium]
MKHFGKLQLIVILLICGILWGYDNNVFSGNRSILEDTYVIGRFGIINGNGNYIHLDKYNISNTLYWKTDVSDKQLLSICEEYDYKTDLSDKTQEEKYNILSVGDAPKTNINVCKIDFKNNKGYIKLTELSYPTYECKFSSYLQYFSCLQDKDIVIFKTESGVEVSRYTNTSTAPRANFEKMEWMSDHELALYDDTWKASYENNILRMDVNTGEVTEVCDSNVSSLLWEGVIERNAKVEDITCRDTPEFEALFGSKEWPVSNLLPSAGPADDRFYFYTRWIDATGIYNGKEWTEGYDRKTGDTFYVSTNDSVLKGIFGDLFIVDWFGWSWF